MSSLPALEVPEDEWVVWHACSMSSVITNYKMSQALPNSSSDCRNSGLFNLKSTSTSRVHHAHIRIPASIPYFPLQVGSAESNYVATHQFTASDDALLPMATARFHCRLNRAATRLAGRLCTLQLWPYQAAALRFLLRRCSRQGVADAILAHENCYVSGSAKARRSHAGLMITRNIPEGLVVVANQRRRKVFRSPPERMVDNVPRGFAELRMERGMGKTAVAVAFALLLQ